MSSIARALLLGLVALAAAGASGAPPTQKRHPATPQPDAQWIALFNGKNLDGWIVGRNNHWVVQDGFITLTRDPDGKEHNGDYLWTKDTYGDFVLELEFKVPERANSGVFLRTSNLKDPVYTGIEVQITNSYGRKALSRGGTAGAIYDCLAPSKNAIRPPGQWNQMQVTCRGSRIVVVLNGQQIIDMDLDRWTEPHRNPDGSKNKFPRALKDFARAGHIGLQDHGLPVWYRKLRIKRLDADTQPPRHQTTQLQRGPAH